MQDIVFYAAANETLGVVRDCTNMLRADAPVLTIGVAVCLKMRLFSAVEVATPYPLSAFTGVANWQWSMDSDFNRNTASKLVADENGISVHTVTDTVNGETRNFTEFVIPISNMNTQELSAWLGAEKTRSGLTGELVGYDSSENAAFVLQVENFTVRNRVAGLADPTALDLETVTRTQAERMIQSAVSSSAATKQDKLTSANAGTGISITSAGIISVSDVPQSAVAGLETSLAGKQNMLTAGYRTAIINGSTVDQARYFAIEPAITAPANQTTSVVLSAGRAYEIHAVAPNAKVLLNREEPVGGAHTFGLEGHAEIFVANTGYIQTGEHVVLSEPLKPDAVNNCTVRFHNNLAIINVEDHIAGYVVTVGTGSTSGTLPYAISSATQDYVAFDASLNGQTLSLAGAVAEGEKHVVGNGYTETAITGAVDCGTSKFTVANLSLDDVQVTGGTMTLGDVYIPNGATVAVSGGGLAIEKVTGNGGTIDLGGTHLATSSGATVSASGCTFMGGHISYGGACANLNGNAVFSLCVISGNGSNTTEPTTGAFFTNSIGAEVRLTGCTVTANKGKNVGAVSMDSGTLILSNSIISGNSANFHKDIGMGNAQVYINGGNTIGNMAMYAGGSAHIQGENSIDIIYSNGAGGTVIINSGAIIDLTGNTNPTPINPGVGIIFEQGGATVYPSAGSASAYTLGGMTVPTIGNTNVVNLGGTNVVVSSGGTAYVSGCTFTGGYTSYGGGAFAVEGETNDVSYLEAVDCVITGNTTSNQGTGLFARTNAKVVMTNCIVSGNKVNTVVARGIYVSQSVLQINGGYYQSILNNGGAVEINGNVKLEEIYTTASNGTVTISSGAVVDLTGNPISAPIVPGVGIVIPAGATVDIIGSDGPTGSCGHFSALAIRGATITNTGCIYGATVTVPASSGTARGPWDLSTTEGMVQVDVPGATAREEVIPGGLYGIEEQ